jgi:hypothetical protein
VGLLILGTGAFLYGHYTKDKTTKTTKATTITHKSETSTKQNAPNIPLTNYSSSIFNFTVNYPTSWAVTSEGSYQTIISPEMSLTADSGMSVKGRITVNFYNQGQIPAAFGTTSVAVLNSKDVTFTNATSAQAAQTYLSFVQYPATTVIGGLDGIYVTGNIGYVKDQNIPSSDINQVSPLIFINFQQCQNQTCSTSTNLTISSKMWSNLSFQTPILDIVKSLSFS